MAALADVADEVLDLDDIQELANPPLSINSAAVALFGRDTLMGHSGGWARMGA